MWMLLLLIGLVQAQPSVHGLEVLQCVDVANQLQEDSKGFEWKSLTGEMYKNGAVYCVITLKKYSTEVEIKGTIINGVFTVLDDKELQNT